MSYLGDLNDETKLFKKKSLQDMNEMLSFKNEKTAKKSAERFEKSFMDANNNDQMRKYAQGVQWAGIQSARASKNPELPYKRRMELQEIGKVYSGTAKGLWKKYNKINPKD
jgi:hypothetical protein